MHHKATEKIYGNVTKNVVLHVENPDSETVSHFRNVHEVKNTHFRDAHEVKDASIQKSRDVKDNQDYIMITQDFLDNFKSNVLKTNGGFNLNSVKYHGSTSYHHGERLPPMFAERLRVLEEKANRKLKVNDKNFYKMKTRPTVHINITGCSTSDDVSATLKDVLSPISKGPGITVTRGMESAHMERREPHPDDIIDSVAKANSVQLDTGSVLPEIRAAPCPIHMKRERGKGQELMYSSNTHAKSPRRLNPHMISLPQNDQSSLYHSPRKTMNIRIPEQFPPKPPLPKQLSSKDFVMTWLIHGSAPQGSNHFPDIVQQRNTIIKAKSKTTPRRSDLSE